jgi:hypothetical protein
VGQSSAHIARARSSTNAVWAPNSANHVDTVGAMSSQATSTECSACSRSVTRYVVTVRPFRCARRCRQGSRKRLLLVETGAETDRERTEAAAEGSAGAFLPICRPAWPSDLRTTMPTTANTQASSPRLDPVGRRTSPTRPFLSAEVGREEPTGHRRAAVGFGPEFDARQTGETRGHVAIEARGSDVLNNPVLRYNLT